MLKKLILLTVFLSLSALADTGEIYMANEAGGWLTLTYQECKVEQIKEQFPWHAYGTEQDGKVHYACYDIPKPPTLEERAEIPQGVSIVPVVNLIDLEDGSIHTLRGDLFTAEKPNTEGTF